MTSWHILFLTLLTQGFYISGDLWAKSHLNATGFSAETFMAPWFAGYFSLRTAATFVQLYLMAALPLGAVMSFLSAANILVTSALAYAFLSETLSMKAYVGILLVSVAVLLIAQGVNVSTGKA